MAIHDRTYMREGEDWRDRAPLPVFLWLVLAYVAGMLVHSGAVHWFDFPLERWTWLSSEGLRAGYVWTLVTHPFVGDIRDVSIGWLFNVAFAYFFGKFVEDWHGRERTLLFAAGAALSGAATFVVASLAGLTRYGVLGGDPAFGIWGVVSACVSYAAFHAPRMRMRLWFLDVPLWVVALVWFALSLASLFRLSDGGTPQLWPDIGGGLFGIACWRLGVPDVRGWMDGMRRGSDRRAAQRSAADRAAVEAKVDALLDRIARDGMSSLSDAERAFLRDASKRY